MKITHCGIVEPMHRCVAHVVRQVRRAAVARTDLAVGEIVDDRTTHRTRETILDRVGIVFRVDRVVVDQGVARILQFDSYVTGGPDKVVEDRSPCVGAAPQTESDAAVAVDDHVVLHDGAGGFRPEVNGVLGQAGLGADDIPERITAHDPVQCFVAINATDVISWADSGTVFEQTPLHDSVLRR